MDTILIIALLGIAASVLALAVFGIIRLAKNHTAKSYKQSYNSYGQYGMPIYPKEEKKQDKKQKKNKKALWIILAAVLLLAAVGVGYWYFFIRSNAVPEQATPYFCMTDSFGDTVVTDEQTAMDAVSEIADQIGINDVAGELSYKYSETVSGTTFYRFDQIYKGIPVLGRSLVISADGGGAPNALTCNYAPVVLERIEPQIDSTTATATAISHLAKILSCEESNCTASKAVLYVYSFSGNDTLAWVINLHAATEYSFAAMRYVVSADTCEILDISRTVNFDHAEIDIEGQIQEQISVPVELDGDNFQLIDRTRDLTVYTPKQSSFEYDYYTDVQAKCDVVSGSLSPKSDLLDIFNNWYLNAGVDAMKNVSSTYDYFKTVLGLDSYNNQNGKINIFVGVTGCLTAEGEKDYIDNAFSSPYSDFAIIAFPKTDKENYALSAWLDIAAHEYTHLVTGSIVFKNRSNTSHQADALEEAYSDIFGELVEQWVCGKTDWIHGAGGTVTDDIRYLYSPRNNYPSHMRDFDPSIDYHINSTIISHTAYLMNADTGDKGAALNFNQLAHLWYGSLFYLHADANFAQCRNAVEIAAKNMLANGDLTEKQVARVSWAFDQVGVGKANNVTAIMVKDNGFELDVSYHDGTKCFDYTYEITGHTVTTSFDGKTVTTKRTYENEKVDSAESPRIVLAPGKYTLCIYATGTNEHGQKVHTTHNVFLNVVDEETIALPDTLSTKLTVFPPAGIKDSAPEPSPKTVHSVWNTIDSSDGSANLTLYDDYTFACEEDSTYASSDKYVLEGTWEDNGRGIRLVITKALCTHSGETTDKIQWLEDESGTDYSANPVFFTYTRTSDNNTLTYSTCGGGSDVYFGIPDLGFMITDWRRDSSIVEPDHTKPALGEVVNVSPSKYDSDGLHLELVATDADKNTVWTYTEDAKNTIFANGSYYPPIEWFTNEQIVYINNADSELLTALDYSTGDVLWQLKGEFGCPIVYDFGNDGTLYIGSSNEFYGPACVAVSADGKELWRNTKYFTTYKIEASGESVTVYFDDLGYTYSVKFDLNGKVISVD